MKKKTKLERYLTFHLEYLTGSKYSNCPFCGCKPRQILSLKEDKKLSCVNKECCLYNHEITGKQWESRVPEHAPICDICGKQAEEIGGCNKCSLTACEDCISEEGWCLECMYDFGGQNKK